MTELNRHFSVVISEVGALTSYRQINILSPTVICVRWFSAFCGRYVQKICPYVTVIPNGTSEFVIKSMVSVTGTSHMLCAKRPSSLANFFIHMLRYLSILMRWQNSRDLTVSLSTIAPEKPSLGKLACIVACSCHRWSAWFCCTITLRVFTLWALYLYARYEVGINVIVANYDTWS